MGERGVRNAEVEGSIPLPSTNPATERARPSRQPLEKNGNAQRDEQDRPRTHGADADTGRDILFQGSETSETG
jgi:hypothetical protein